VESRRHHAMDAYIHMWSIDRHKTKMKY